MIKNIPLVKINYANCLSEYVGEQGIDRADLQNLSGKIKQITKDFEQKIRNNDLGFAQLPEDKNELNDILNFARRLRNKFDNFVVIGIGGSALGNIALQQALGHPFWNLLSPKNRRGWLRIFVLDNIDPKLLAGLKEVIDFRRTIFNVISKSGTTVECLANFFALKETLQKVNKNYLSQLVITTDGKKGYLREFAEREKIVTFTIPGDLGGRFSVFSPVGLLSTAAAGIEIKQILAGAQLMNDCCKSEDLWKNPAALYAAIHYLFYKKGRKLTVMLPYTNSLFGFSDWFCQLWAESLGKRFNQQGEEINLGFTPIKASGVTDQHSQLQLYMEGPQDKVITFVSVKNFPQKVAIPTAGSNLLKAKSLNELIQAEEKATRLALTRNQRPNLTIYLPELSPFIIGQLFQMFEWAVTYVGELFQINTFDQPGVELGKQLTKAILGQTQNKEEQNKILAEISQSEQSPFVV